jgi:ubiquinone/menaquinone biosynthesis C-methylase UbiE
MERRTSSFEGTGGRLAGLLMARLNRDMEVAAIDELAPAHDASVLAVGFGPGVGVAALAKRVPSGVVGGVDPSATMVQQARRRSLPAVESGRIALAQGTAHAIPWPDGTFAGVLAVNSMQLWDPLDASVQEIVRVLAPAGRLVAITHVWAIEKRSPLEQWMGATSELLVGAGLDGIAHRTASFRSGTGLVLRAEKRRLCNRKAP